MCCRKYIFFVLLAYLIICPFSVFSADDRGIKIKSSGLSSITHLGDYHALIIGINKYKEWNPLKTAVKDAEALKKILIWRYGFRNKNVVLKTDRNATRRNLINDLRNLASILGNKDNLLIYFAGHGQLDDLTGDGYWIPVEGKLKDPSTWISHSTIKNILISEKVRGKNIVVVADSCYSGTLLRGGPSLLSIDSQGYRSKLLKLASNRSRQVITSGGLEPVADGGRDGHSLFAYYFLKALKDNDRDLIDFENLFHTRVWKYVTEIGGQRPNVGRLKTPMDEDGQFILATRGAVMEAPVKTDKADTALDAEHKKLEQERMELERLKTDHPEGIKKSTSMLSPPKIPNIQLPKIPEIQLPKIPEIQPLSVLKPSEEPRKKAALAKKEPVLISSEELHIKAPAVVLDLLNEWKDKYVFFAHRDADIKNFSDLNEMRLFIAVINADTIMQDAQNFKKVSDVNMQLAIQNNPKFYHKQFLDNVKAVGMMVPIVAEHYKFKRNDKLVRIVFEQ